MQIIKSYNRTVHKYNIDPIIIDCESEVTRGDSIYFDEISNNIIIDDLHCKNKSSNCDDSPNGSNESKEMESICVGADLVEEIIDCDPIEVDGSILNPDSPCMENNEDLINDIHCNGTISDISDKAEQDLINSELLPHTLDIKSEETLIYDPDDNATPAINYTFAAENSVPDGEMIADEPFKMVFEQVDNLYFCLLCGELKPLSAEPFAEHMLQYHDLNFYACEHCSAGFLSAESVKEHIENTHTNFCIATEVDSPEYECNVCQQVFANHRLLRVHKRTHNNTSLQYECSECNKKYSCQNLLLDHMNIHIGRRPYKCTKCPKDFTSKCTLQTHLKIHSERLRPYKCNKCNKSFLNPQSLTHHKKLHLGEKAFICDICLKAFSTQHNLDIHKIVHTGQRPFVCRTCGKAFARRAEIKDHERIHTGEKPYKCDMCEAAFAQRSNLMTHRKSTHLNEKSHKCDQCDRSFKRRRLLQYHINAVHTGVRPHECEICGSSFVYPEHKKKHMLIHGNSKPYTCEVCGKEFNSCANRNAHRYVHSSKKPYECIKCGAGFMRKPLLLAHMKHAGHTTDTIVINQPHISGKGMLSLEREMSTIDSCDDICEVAVSSSQESNSSVCNEGLQLIPPHTEDISDVAETESVQYLQFDDLDKDGHQVITWVDIGRDKHVMY
ncbi:unnamed protein product [Ceratitis capitata]|nr:unnamed protein product [Ceratitis capitata]